MPLKERVVPGLAFLVFFLAGIAASGQVLVLPLWRQYQARSWQSTPCRILRSSLAGDGGLQLKFQYTVDGKAYESSRYGFLLIGTNETDYFRNLIVRYPANTEATCYVNPADPSDAVLDRSVPGRVWKNSPLMLFVLVGAVGLLWTFGLFRRRPITDSRLEAICRKNGSLQLLDLEDSRVTDSGLANLRDLLALRDLDLSGTQITDAGLRELKPLKSLEFLALDDTAVTDHGLTYLVDLDQLNTLSLSGTKVTGRGIAILVRMRNLEDVNLSGTHITDDGLADLQPNTSLHWLDLSGTAITDNGLRHLANLSALKFLTLDETAVTDAGVEHLSKLSSLEGLYLSDTGVTQNGTELLHAALPDCEIEI